MAISGVGGAGSTLQLFVGDGVAARAWYERLFDRPPDFEADGDSFCEWVFHPGSWEVHVVQHETPGLQRGRFRFGVEDVDAVRAALLAAGVDVSPVESLEGVVRYCNFSDPWDNRLGLYQDLSRFPGTAR
jgi:predicted enzyme related to lactoylglutathione lyase